MQMKIKQAATLISCEAGGMNLKHIFIRALDGDNLWFTVGNKRKEELKRLKQNFMLIDGHKSVSYPLPYEEEHGPGFTVQKSRFAFFDPRYAQEYKEWAKSFDRNGLTILAEG